MQHPSIGRRYPYVQVAAGYDHTFLLKSDGTAVACGRNLEDQCNIPALADGATYVQVAAGFDHTVLLKSDGTAVACGSNGSGQCNIPALAEGEAYGLKQIVLTVHLVNSQAVFYLLSGREFVRIEVDTADDFAGILMKFKKEIGPDHRRYHVVLPTGGPLRSAMPTAKRRRLE